MELGVNRLTRSWKWTTILPSQGMSNCTIFPSSRNRKTRSSRNSSKLSSTQKPLTFPSRNSEYTFHPNLSNTKDSAIYSDRLQLPFMQRLAMDCQLREYKDAMIAEANDPKQYRRMAYPVTGRGPSTRQASGTGRAGNVDVCISLYENAFKLQNKKMLRKHKHNEELKQ